MIVRGLFFIFVAGCASCAHPVATFYQNSIDARYRWHRLNQRTTNDRIGASSLGIKVYQKAIRQTLGSSCTLFPNDSAYAAAVYRHCGPIPGIIKTMSRFYLEPDAPMLSNKVMASSVKVLWLDLPETCNLF